jgi:hypothetical protein
MNKYILLISCISLLLVSCKKENSSANDCNNIVQGYNYNPVGSPILTATFTYDGAGRVSSVKGELQNASSYTYYKDHIVLNATDIYGNNISNYYFLDNAGRIVGPDSNYQYNSAGYMTLFKSGSSYYTLTYTNGDLTEMFTPDLTVSRKRVVFTYYNEPNQDLMGYNSPLYIGDAIYDRNSFFLIHKGAFGKQSQHLLKDITFYDQSNTPTGGGRETYEYDSTGRITAIDGEFSFTYQCP